MKELNEEQLMNVVGGISKASSEPLQCIQKCLSRYGMSSTKIDEDCKKECTSSFDYSQKKSLF
mgnify:CR=1 FL=1